MQAGNSLHGCLLCTKASEPMPTTVRMARVPSEEHPTVWIYPARNGQDMEMEEGSVPTGTAV